MARVALLGVALMLIVGICEGNEWCIANSSIRSYAFEVALNETCLKVDCSAISEGGECFSPNTLPWHASYAFNLYFQNNGRTLAACHALGMIVQEYPVPPSASYCHFANASIS
ncbi:hypothetical protein SELMODRAFT_406336 [Selaginella moellendorffii]|uniref:X8 domain-containing protein n=1 Tax=Selaginella moellendorffii TaxID=88036 RepID=D8R218_SELML|nr:glucan endo-1,3-beta-glucosidase [Selaginella moellendorffii]EFJ33648.1 hypothetical protein SELMODRAFT_406336 [Selaginella moellendorffii]|eukprot:XP_002964810.1 glucan endo-1,3-beta-glucosidase [Selaginella moellendorffii]